jgi:predicted metal-dependent hydrolase
LAKKAKSDLAQNTAQAWPKKPNNNIEENRENNNTVNGSKLLKNLANLNLPDEQVDYITDYILHELGDKHSAKFYKLVSRKIPESVIRKALSEIKVDGAKHPAKVFVHRMKEYVMRDARRGLAKSF